MSGLLNIGVENALEQFWNKVLHKHAIYSKLLQHFENIFIPYYSFKVLFIKGILLFCFVYHSALHVIITLFFFIGNQFCPFKTRLSVFKSNFKKRPFPWQHRAFSMETSPFPWKHHQTREDRSNVKCKC
jgi:hypothetical protein